MILNNFEYFGRISVIIVVIFYFVYFFGYDCIFYMYIIFGINGYVVVRRNFLKIFKVIIYFFCFEK